MGFAGLGAAAVWVRVGRGGMPHREPVSDVSRLRQRVEQDVTPWKERGVEISSVALSRDGRPRPRGTSARRSLVMATATRAVLRLEETASSVAEFVGRQQADGRRHGNQCR
jgi:hypothetical protein